MDDVKQNDLEYAIEWYKYGLRKNDDAIVKFMMHWIAFNWLYSAYRQHDERAKIRAFCQDRYEELSRYDAFATGAFLVFTDSPVTDELTGNKRTMSYRNLSSHDKQTQIESLLLTIYQVRCNLFHGSKRLRVQRDIELVRSSSIILEGYLKALFGDHPLV